MIFKTIKTPILIILVLVVFAVFGWTSGVEACSCSKIMGYYEYLKTKHIIWRIEVNDVDYSLEILETEDTKDAYLTGVISYELEENISNSKVPDDTVMKHIKRIPIKLDSYCSCYGYLDRSKNTANELLMYGEYVVFLSFNDQNGVLEISEAIPVNGDYMGGDFGVAATWETYSELKAELTRQDPNVYEVIPPENSTIFSRVGSEVWIVLGLVTWILVFIFSMKYRLNKVARR